MHHRLIAPLSAITSLLALLAPGAHASSSAGDVWIVDDDGGPGADFVDVQSAIVAATDGDVILVRAGIYGTANLVGRSLTILADVGPRPRLAGLFVEGTPLGGKVLVRGLSVDLAPFGSPAVTMTDNAGLVWLEDVFAFGAPAGRISGANGDLVAVRTRFQGQPGTFLPFGPIYPPGVGLRVEGPLAPSTRLHLQDCVVEGGQGSSSAVYPCCNQDGAPGYQEYQVVPFQLVAAGCAFRGGWGANGYWILDPFDPFGQPLGCVPGRNGGYAFNSKGDLFELDCTFTGGAGGSKPSGTSTCGPGFAGADKLFSGTEVLLPGPLRTYEVSSPVREGQPIQLEFQGQPGDLAYLLFSTDVAPVYLGPCQGTLLPALSPGLLVIFVGPVDAAGALSVTVPAPSLPSGVESLVAATQANLVSPDVTCHVTTASAFVLVDASF